MTRARYCAGDAEVGAAFEAERIAILRRERDAEKLRGDVVSMRMQMLDAHPNKSGLFDLKHDRGGMIDIEFIVQYLVLAHAHRYPQLTGNLGNIALLKMAGELGLIPLETALTVRDGYREYRKRQHAERLNGAPYARVGQGRWRSTSKPRWTFGKPCSIPHQSKCSADPGVGPPPREPASKSGRAGTDRQKLTAVNAQRRSASLRWRTCINRPHGDRPSKREMKQLRP